MSQKHFPRIIQTIIRKNVIIPFIKLLSPFNNNSQSPY